MNGLLFLKGEVLVIAVGCIVLNPFLGIGFHVYSIHAGFDQFNNLILKHHNMSHVWYLFEEYN